ncbi:MAG: hypothetical protein RIB58_01720 [Phycisphaerales bacterium]
MLDGLKDDVAHRMMLDGAVPASIRRPMRWCWLAAMLVVLGFIGLIALVHLGVIGPIHPALPLVIIAAIFVMRAAAVRVARRASGRAIAAGCVLCPRCDYDLRRHAAAGLCPECGTPYERKAMRQRWIDAERRLWPGWRGRI